MTDHLGDAASAGRQLLVNRLAGAMQEAIEDELAAFARDLDTGLQIADAIIRMEGH